MAYGLSNGHMTKGAVRHYGRLYPSDSLASCTMRGYPLERLSFSENSWYHAGEIRQYLALNKFNNRT